MINDLLASIEKCSDYCYEFPFSPSERYPEYPFSDYSKNTNAVYNAVRNHLLNLGLDTVNFGTKDWNPLKEFNLIGKKIIQIFYLKYYIQPSKN